MIELLMRGKNAPKQDFFSDFIDPAPAFASPMMILLGSPSYFFYSFFNHL
jgi:hypothetical protein